MSRLSLTSNSRDVVTTFFNQAWRIIAGPVVMICIPFFLSEKQQGYWYLFGSLSALSVFADLGFSNIILQFAAHEFAFLSKSRNGILEGHEQHLRRLGSFFKFTLRWLATISAVVFPIIYIVGVVFLNRDQVLAEYVLPWTIFAIGSLIGFVNNSILSFVEGLESIAIVQKIRLTVSIINSCLVILLLVLKGHLYALAIASLVSSSFIFLFIFGVFFGTFKQLVSVSKGDATNWKKEVLPLFTRYAISFSSGYFIFQIYTPLMHLFHGPEMSGRVGISLSLVNAIFGISNIWMYTITPKINILISKKDYNSLDALFKKRLIWSLLSYLLLSMMAIAVVQFCGSIAFLIRIISRFLPLQSIVILLLCYFFQLIVNSIALYLRGHKQEPFVYISVISAIWIALITYLSGQYLPKELFFLGFLSSYAWGLPVSLVIFFSCRRKWHEKPDLQ